MMDRGRPKLNTFPSNPSTSKSPSSRQQAVTPKIEPVRRKPLPSSASPITGRVQPLSSGGVVVAVGEDDAGDYNSSLPKRQSFLQDPPSLPPSNIISPPLQVRDLDQFPRGYSPRGPQQSEYFPIVSTENRQPSPRPQRARQASESRLHEAPRAKAVPNNLGLQRAMSLRPSNRPTNDDYEPSDPTIITKTPRSPGPNKLTSFFGWKTSSPIAEAFPTTYSDGSHSPVLPSPLSQSPHSIAPSSKSTSRIAEIPKANGNMSTQYFAGTGFPVPPGADGAGLVNDVDEELREVSIELAGSIRRELELEDLVDQLRLEASQGPELGRRTSDYFSDSGSGSYRYPLSDAGAGKGDDLAKMRRISEQEKAQFKLNLTQKLQDERDQRKGLEDHVQQLGRQMANMDEERAMYSAVVTKVHDLENSLEDHRRRLQEERRAKTNFEDLLTALRGEIAQHQDERDNLRDEVVPQLKSRLEGLEVEAAEHQKLTYDNARMQQELQSLKMEGSTLMSARRPQMEMQNHGPQFNTIAEEGQSDTQGAGTSLTRSGSVAGQRAGLPRAGILKRSNSVSNKEREFRDNLADRVKDIEMQRDALHRALKSLLDRQNYQKHEHEKRTRNLEAERDRALQNQSPRRMGYEKEVTGLRFEINQLRRRAEDASMQKYHIEKGLGGLKKDLDRAEQETSSLRKVLQEHDILIPEISDRSSPDATTGAHATSASLERAYRDLQVTQAMSITKLRELHGGAPSSAEDADTAATMDKLLKSMNDAEAERDYAKKQAAIFRAQAESLMEAESFHSGENAGLVNQLRASADRVEALSSQVRLQLESNAGLRQRLAEAVGRGEEAQKNSTTRINSMQGKLKNLEDQLMNAQQHSEEAFAQHEDEVREIRESHNQQLQRLKTGLKTPTRFSSAANSPQSPTAMFGGRSPKLDRTTTGLGKSLDEALKTQYLEKRVAELERALGEADLEMEEVVGRMNQAQIEVMELQSARDEAMRQTRRLQAAINAERETVDKLMMK